MTVDDVEYSVTNVAKSSGNEYETPKQGCEFVRVSVKIENKGNEKISYNLYDWKMENSQGYEESETFALMNNDTALNSGDLNPGGVKEGTMVFEQPAGDTGLKLNFYGNVFYDEASFKITIE